MNHSPATLLAEFLIGDMFLGDPEGSSLTWPAYVGFMPDKAAAPDDLVVLTDTEGLKDGRLMTGENVNHGGVQILVRCRSYGEGWAKLAALCAALEAAAGEEIEISSSTSYTILNVSQQGPILSLGLEEATRRFLLTANFLTTIREE